LRESRRKLCEVLTYKLQAKYAQGDPFRKQEVGKLVATFVGTSRGIGEEDLVKLENKVQSLLGAPPAAMSGRPDTTMSRRSSHRAGDIPGNAKEILRKVGVANPDQVPATLTSEWNLLDLYNSVNYETEQEAFAKKVQNDKLEQRRILQEQMEERRKMDQKEQEAQKRYDDKQQKLFENWKEEQKELKEKQKNLMMDEKAVRTQQLMEKELEKHNERRNALYREQLELEMCEKELAEEARAKHNAILKERERMKRILHENERNEQRKKEALKMQAVEDIRLMHEYTAKLNREEQERAEAFNRRIERYKVLGELWENKGAGKAQREEELKLERKILADAAKKEHEDILREQREKMHRKNQLLHNIEENQKIIKEKERRQRLEKEEDDRYASNYRKEGEDYVRENVQRERQRQQMLLEQRRHLEVQIEEVRSRPKDEMSSTERRLNAQLLKRLQQDHNTMKKVQDKATLGRSDLKRTNGITSTFGRMGIGGTTSF